MTKKKQGKRKTWKQEVRTLSDVQKLVHLAMRYDSKTAYAIEKALVQARRTEIESTIREMLAEAGCNASQVTAKLKTPAITKEIRRQSRRDARSIARTYNYHLAREIKRIAKEEPKANRHTYAAKLRSWESGRATWKDNEIAANTRLTARTIAQKVFIKNNKARGRAYLAGPDPAAEEICQGWLNRGYVKASVAQRNPSPFHIKCIHYWIMEVAIRKSLDCEDMWNG
jgi:poly-D-alanine transfer protein DltD